MSQSTEVEPSRTADQAVKDRISAKFAQVGPALVGLSDSLHDDPEIGWQEFRSSAAVAGVLADHGFRVEQPYLDLETAFRATFGTGDFTIGFLAEYDALPGLGHACGHNLISAMSVGAAIGLATVAEELGISVEVIGTPAEEGGGGKIELLERGAFTNLDFALMAHPAPVDVAEAQPFAVTHWHVEYTGRAAHAAAYPERGINANDAFLVAQVALGLLRQQLPKTVRVHGVMTNGGEAPNAIPAKTEGRWYVRAETTEELLEVEKRVIDCFEAGALATGASLSITPESKRYAEMRTDEDALEAYRANAIALGRNFDVDPVAATMNRASTDMGNVSQIVNAIHPYIGVGGEASNHQAAFAESCVGDEAERTLLDGATALAWTAADMAVQRG
ncbi:MAG: M20 family metallopeptidase [Brevibacterium aurantiacum]|uniref:Peptidase M20 domain-containing protein 2 n=1 Tax=Brevibacterium aurantiacum TaxID=273384 RepID=A0A3T0DL71_BREAU|nr:M20 family metallopeptidase [Brevibacterium aurantiacum]AZT95841.1 amidohydrolase [Brevibacterium aurantiacum]RCS84728.1 M20 family peptidase [Brevibacterium aurantiacum]